MGAGATIPIGGPTSSMITTAIRNRRQRVLEGGAWQERPFLEEVTSRLDEYLSPLSANFEDVLHVLETLGSYKSGWDNVAAVRFRPRPAAFVAPTEDRWRPNDQMFRSAIHDVYHGIGDCIQNSVQAFKPDTDHRWFGDFWREAFGKANWDLATLNYDDLFDRVIAPEAEDGFTQPSSENGTPFNPERLMRCSRIRLLHLHGSFRFGYSKILIDTNRDPTAYNELFKFASYSDARETWFTRSTNYSQANVETISGPMITGLHKPDKLTAEPYGEYQAILRDALKRSPRLLIIGYSFGDLYLNSLLNSHTAFHQNNRRIIVIGYFPNTWDWHVDLSFLNQTYNWPGNDMAGFLHRAMRTTQILGNSLTRPKVIESPDGHCRLYLEGGDSIRDEGHKIMEFLIK